MRVLLFVLCAALTASACAEPVTLRFRKISRIILSRENPHWVRARIPAEHQIAGVQELEFQFTPDHTGEYTTPRADLTIEGKRFTIPETKWLVFAEAPKKLTCVVSGWPHPEWEHIYVVQVDAAGGKETDQPRFGLVHRNLIDVPPGFEAYAKGGAGGAGVSTNVLHFWNPTGKSVTLTRKNFSKDCKLPPDFPEIVIPPTKPKPE